MTKNMFQKAEYVNWTSLSTQCGKCIWMEGVARNKFLSATFSCRRVKPNLPEFQDAVHSSDVYRSMMPESIFKEFAREREFDLHRTTSGLQMENCIYLFWATFVSLQVFHHVVSYLVSC